MRKIGRGLHHASGPAGPHGAIRAGRRAAGLRPLLRAQLRADHGRERPASADPRGLDAAGGFAAAGARAGTTDGGRLMRLARHLCVAALLALGAAPLPLVAQTTTLTA